MINNEIIQALKLLGLPTYWISRGKENPHEWIVFNYLEAPKEYSNMQEEKTEFNILINIYCKKQNLATYREQSKKLLNENGFVKVQINNAFYNDELMNYCIPLNYKFYKYN